VVKIAKKNGRLLKHYSMLFIVFGKQLRKVTIISVMYIRPYETTALLLGAFS
jgi:hypothetical protein